MDNDLEKDVREELAKHGSVFKTCRQLGIDNVQYVSDIANEMKAQESPDLSACEFEGFGDPEKKNFLVARSLAVEVWDNSRPEVADAREKFEAGTHNMLTGRDGPYVLLYLFPRAVKEPRPGYFTLSSEG